MADVDQSRIRDSPSEIAPTIYTEETVLTVIKDEPSLESRFEVLRRLWTPDLTDSTLNTESFPPLTKHNLHLDLKAGPSGVKSDELQTVEWDEVLERILRNPVDSIPIPIPALHSDNEILSQSENHHAGHLVRGEGGTLQWARHDPDPDVAFLKDEHDFYERLLEDILRAPDAPSSVAGSSVLPQSGTYPVLPVVNTGAYLTSPSQNRISDDFASLPRSTRSRGTGLRPHTLLAREAEFINDKRSQVLDSLLESEELQRLSLELRKELEQTVEKCKAEVEDPTRTPGNEVEVYKRYWEMLRTLSASMKAVDENLEASFTRTVGAQWELSVLEEKLYSSFAGDSYHIIQNRKQEDRILRAKEAILQDEESSVDTTSLASAPTPDGAFSADVFVNGVRNEDPSWSLKIAEDTNRAMSSINDATKYANLMPATRTQWDATAIVSQKLPRSTLDEAVVGFGSWCQQADFARFEGRFASEEPLRPTTDLIVCRNADIKAIYKSIEMKAPTSLPPLAQHPNPSDAIRVQQRIMIWVLGIARNSWLELCRTSFYGQLETRFSLFFLDSLWRKASFLPKIKFDYLAAVQKLDESLAEMSVEILPPEIKMIQHDRISRMTRPHQTRSRQTSRSTAKPLPATQNLSHSGTTPQHASNMPNGISKSHELSISRLAERTEDSRDSWRPKKLNEYRRHRTPDHSPVRIAVSTPRAVSHLSTKSM